MSESKITPRTIYRAVLLAFALIVGGLLFKELITLVLAVLIVVIIALPLASFADFLERFHIPRGLGAVIGLLILFGAIAGLILLVIPAFSTEVNKFADSLPSVVDKLRHRLGSITGTSPTKIGKQLQDFVNGYTQHPAKLLGPLTSIGGTVVAALAAIVVVILTALYTAIHPTPLINGMVRLVPPGERDHARQILARLRTAYMGWLRGLIAGMLVLGTLTYIGLQIIGLPLAVFFAIFTAIAMIIPYFGALASSIPPILYALTFSPTKAILVAALYIVAHQLEGNIIQPLVVARAVKMHPAVIAVGVVAVEELFGFVGLIVAVPILATIQILISELWIKGIEGSPRRLVIGRPGSPPAPVQVPSPIVVPEGLPDPPPRPGEANGEP
jgi:predicted PurR-regulated permease PerM